MLKAYKADMILLCSQSVPHATQSSMRPCVAVLLGATQAVMLDCVGRGTLGLQSRIISAL